MISFLSNRHYHSLTQLLPAHLRVDQPQKIYYKTSINQGALKLLQENQKITHRTLATTEKKKTITRKRTINIKDQELNACPLCYQTHISVKYHGHKHICSKCRALVRDQFGQQIKIFLNERGEIVCLGILPKSFERSQVGYYVTNHTKLQISGTGVYGTFAGEGELVLILKDKNSHGMDHKIK